MNVKLKGIRVTYNKQTDQLTFFDGKGKKILEEVASTGRVLSNSQLADGNNRWSDVSQSFVSPTDEFLFGTGQFQDGYLNIRGLTRRLTQVNTQIAVPFMLSSKGYGLLWNNYGLTDFNPSTNSAVLQGTDEQGNVIEVNTTSTTGTGDAVVTGVTIGSSGTAVTALPTASVNTAISVGTNDKVTTVTSIGTGSMPSTAVTVSSKDEKTVLTSATDVAVTKGNS